MVTDRQIAANRRNAQKSTGPKTEAGKADSRNNALTHGLTAQNFPLQIEDEPEFNWVREGFLAEYQPATQTELALVEQIAVAFWRLRRIRIVEARYLDQQLEYKAESAERRHGELDDWGLLAYAASEDLRCSSVLLNLSRYEYRLERSFSKAIRELKALQALATATPQTANPQIGFVSPPAPKLVANPDNSRYIGSVCGNSPDANSQPAAPSCRLSPSPHLDNGQPC